MRNSFVQWERRLRFGSERPELDTLGDSETISGGWVCCDLLLQIAERGFGEFPLPEGLAL